MRHQESNQPIPNSELFYRNNQEVVIENVVVDVGSLWKRKEDLMILVDDDQYIEYPFSGLFEITN